MNVTTARTMSFRNHATSIVAELRALAVMEQSHELQRLRLEKQLEEVLAQMDEPQVAVVSPRILSAAAVARIAAWMSGDVDVSPPRPPATARWLAERCDISPTHMHFVLERKRECSARVLEAIASVTGIAVEDLAPLAAGVGVAS